MDIGFSNGHVSLESAAGVYYPGQKITGNINFRLDQHVNVTAINIQFLGEARVLWWEDETQNRNGQSFKTKTEYRSQELYFNNVICLEGGQSIIQLKPGRHTIPFQYQIPFKVPSSFKGEKGQVEYKIYAFMEFPDPVKDREKIVRPFEVVAPLDLNKAGLEVARPLHLSFEEVYSCGCACSPSPVSVEVTAPACGYCPRQALPVTVHVVNRANVEVRSILLQLLSKVRYHSQRPVANCTTPDEVLVSTKTGPVLSNSERHFTCELTVPDMIAPCLDDCSVIDLEYYLRVKIKLSGCNEDLEDKSQIFIGLKPLDSVTNGEYVHPMAHSLPSGPIPDCPAEVTQTKVNKPVGGYPVYPATSGYQKSVPSGPLQHSPGNITQRNIQAKPVSGYPGYPPTENRKSAGHGYQPVPTLSSGACYPNTPPYPIAQPNHPIPYAGIGFKTDLLNTQFTGDSMQNVVKPVPYLPPGYQRNAMPSFPPTAPSAPPLS